MNKVTLKALKGSIKKWEGIVAGVGVDTGWRNCPLCTEFHKDDSCDGCPVKAATGEDMCDGSPYEDWVESTEPVWRLDRFDGKPWRLRAADDESVMCAVLELEFLKSLLPGAK